MAGFCVLGLDIKPQPRYAGDRFIQADALRPPVRLSDFDLVWASPPCQANSSLRTMWNAKDHMDRIPETRAMLESEARLWVIENVPGANMRRDAILCGTHFGLETADGTGELRRHRWFEASFPLGLQHPCQHGGPVIGVYGGHGRDRRRTVNVCGDGGSERRVVEVYGHSGGSRARRRTVGVYGNVGSEWRGGPGNRERSQPDRIKAFPTRQRREAMGIDWMNGEELSQAIPPAYSAWIGYWAMLALGHEPRPWTP